MSLPSPSVKKFSDTKPVELSKDVSIFHEYYRKHQKSEISPTKIKICSNTKLITCGQWCGFITRTKYMLKM